MEIITQSPSWFILLCVVAGAVYAGALYFRDKFNRTYGSRLAAVLGTLRFIVVTLLAFFLLRPLIKTIRHDVEKPIVVIAQDNSESLTVHQSKADYQNTYLPRLKALQEALGNDYEVRAMTFGESVKDGIDNVTFDEKLTDFNTLFDELTSKFSGRNLGAVVIASDGLYNKGSNPVYSSKKLNTALYTVALGDTTVHRDVLIAGVAANRLAYLHNKFPVEINVEGRKASGETVVLNVSHQGNTVYTENITFGSDRAFKTVQLLQEAKAVGLQKYTITVSTLKNEITTINNRKDIFIDVLDSRQKILILAAAPHPDVQALRESIQWNDAYTVEAELATKFRGNIADYNLVIFHQLPSLGGGGLQQVQNALSRSIPSLFIWAAQTDFKAFNDLETGFALQNYRNANTEVNASVATEFGLFRTEQPVLDGIRSFPPISVPFGDMRFSPGVQTFLLQQVGQIKTDNPLIAFNKYRETKIGLIAGEGIWRWHLQAFRQFGSHDAFNDLTSRMVQYLATKEDKSLFRVNGKNDYPENEQVVFDAELYNASYEPIIDKDIRMVIRNESGNEYTYAFSPVNGRYRLNAGNLPAGNYSYMASVISDGQTLKKTGEFSITPLQLELTNTVADHRMLHQLATEHGGKMYVPEQMAQMAEDIRAREDITSVSYETKNLNDLIRFKWILFLLLFLLGMEWLLRKRAGTY